MFLSRFFKKEANSKKVAPTQPSLPCGELYNRSQYEKENNRKALRKGELGEYKIDIQLAQLPKECRFISDLMLHNPRAQSGYSQIDHVVLSPYGVFVIETKNYSGNISGSEKDKKWLRDDKYEFLNPFRQNYGHLQTVKEHLKNFDTESFYSIITFTLRATISNVDEELKNVRTSSKLVIYDTALLDTITRRLAIMARGGKQALSKLDVDQMQASLSRANITDVQIREEHVNKNKYRQPVDLGNITCNGEVCAFCGRPVSLKVKDYCLANRKRFDSKVYCFEHQKDF